MAKVESSNLADVSYDEKTSVLTVMFKNAGTYQYPGVPVEMYQTLLKEKSPGSYYNGTIKQHFEGKRVPTLCAHCLCEVEKGQPFRLIEVADVATGEHSLRAVHATCSAPENGVAHEDLS